MRRLLPIAVLLLGSTTFIGCDEKKQAGSSGSGRTSASSREEAASSRRAAGKNLFAYAPESDFSGAAPEDASSGASAMFDGTRTRGGSGGGVTAAGYTPGVTRSGGRRRIPLTAASSDRVSDLRTPAPPLPDDHDFSGTGANPGKAKGASQTLLDFASFQVSQRFPSVAPIMSRLGWSAASPSAERTPDKPHQVTVHHTAGENQGIGEAEAARVVKGIQTYHMVGRAAEGKQVFADIGYHFLLAGDGRVIEGRPVGYLGAHIENANTGRIGIALIGNFNHTHPKAAQVESLTRLVTFLSVKYKQDPAAEGFLQGHRPTELSSCPGTHLGEILGKLRAKIDRENEVIVSGGIVGGLAEFKPLAVLGAPKA